MCYFIRMSKCILPKYCMLLALAKVYTFSRGCLTLSSYLLPHWAIWARMGLFLYLPELKYFSIFGSFSNLFMNASRLVHLTTDSTLKYLIQSRRSYMMKSTKLMLSPANHSPVPRNFSYSCNFCGRVLRNSSFLLCCMYKRKTPSSE